ncbi:FAD:protein FMN transferase [Salinibacterium sp. ZJ454]|uniref:FAD:protein FMN transferase n=1 Tax=Salinibacterium sp. ZJ454 TaxID=2708339 RepID=UPI00141FE801|nr:FAD:protein FMN transferase [Salinibacterium sp. ZJ454]
MPAGSLSFEAIGTRWQIDTPDPLPPAVITALHDRIDRFDRDWSRFRTDSLVARMARTPGRWQLPDDATPLLELYRNLYEATDGAVSPLIGRSLETLGYDRDYSLRPSGPPVPPPRWEDAIAWDGTHLTTVRPVSVDIGAAGKGYLVDIVGTLLTAAGIPEHLVDAGGDIRHTGSDSIRVALEHPLDPSKAIGVVTLSGRAICASASNRRAWGDGLHHVLDATTGLPTRRVIATWAIADSALVADGVATALFFRDADRLRSFEFEHVRMFSDGHVEWSQNLTGEVFA